MAIKRRAFVKGACVFTGLIWVPKGIAQLSPTSPFFTAGVLKPAAGSGGCTTSNESFTGASTDTLSFDAGSSTNYRLATQFVAATSYSPCAITIRASLSLSGATGVGEFWSSSGAGTAPNTQLGSSGSSVDMNTFPASEGDITFGGITGVSLTAGTTYHAVVRLVSGGGNFGGRGLWHARTGVSTSVAFSMSYNDGSWNDINGGATQTRFLMTVKS